MSNTQIFCSFLKSKCPSLVGKIKKCPQGYITVLPLEQAGHRFIYNTKEQTITHIFYRPVFVGTTYEKRISMNVYKIDIEHKISFREVV